MEGETEEKMVAVSLKNKKGVRGCLGARVASYLDFTPFHQRAVKLLSGPLRIHARLECYKTKALRGDGGQWRGKKGSRWIAKEG